MALLSAEPASDNGDSMSCIWPGFSLSFLWPLHVIIVACLQLKLVLTVASACVDCCMCLQLELILTAATLCIAIIGVISGLFGMNLHNTHEDSYFTFVLVRCLPSLVSVTTCVLAASINMPLTVGSPCTLIT